ncbi:MAG: hypothetical protein ACFFAS_10390 [Promethearchaeota archaeon]
MSDILVFYDSVLEVAGVDYNKIALSVEQRENIDAFARIINRFIPITERALKGFIWRVLREIQAYAYIDFKKEAEGADLTLEERMEGIKTADKNFSQSRTRTIIRRGHPEGIKLL